MATSWDQTHVRFGNDDGNESGRTWLWAANAGGNLNLTADKQIRVRVGVKQTGTTAAGFTGFLRYNRNAGGWTQVNASSSYARSAASPYLADGAAMVSQLLTSGTYRSGIFDEVDGAAGTATSTAQNEVTEDEFCVNLRSAELLNADTISFQVYRTSSLACQAYSSGTVTITIAKTYAGSGSPSASKGTANAAGSFGSRRRRCLISV